MRVNRNILFIGGIRSTFAGNTASRYAPSSAALSALSPSFNTSPMSIEQAPPTRLGNLIKSYCWESYLHQIMIVVDYPP